MLNSSAMRRIRILWSVLFVCSLALAACSSSSASPPATTTPESAPLGTVNAWFAAINHKDGTLAGTFFTPTAQREQPESLWSTYQSDGPPFANVKCGTHTQQAKTAVVVCTFTEAPSPDAGNPDSFWAVSLEKSAGGRWLITGYGQG